MEIMTLFSIEMKALWKITVFIKVWDNRNVGRLKSFISI